MDFGVVFIIFFGALGFAVWAFARTKVNNPPR